MVPLRFLAAALLLPVVAVQGWALRRRAGPMRGAAPSSWTGASKYVSGVYSAAEDGEGTHAWPGPPQAAPPAIEYQSQNVTPHVDHFKIMRGNTTIMLEVDKLNGTVSAACPTCAGLELPTEMKAELHEFSQSNKLRLMLPDSNHYGVLGQLASWASKVPKGVVLSVVSVRMYTYISCLEKYDLAEAVWSVQGGRRAHKTVLVGNSVVPGYECQGKCGSDCANTYGAYTQNCLNHDSCSLAAHSVHGLLDSACGDEWRNAMGDYMMGFVACRGVKHAM